MNPPTRPPSPNAQSAHEARIATVLQARPGDKILDCGCGVGGPMRTIAAVSGASVTGITINEYQVQRAMRHNSKVGLEWGGGLSVRIRGRAFACGLQLCSHRHHMTAPTPYHRPQQGLAPLTNVVRGDFTAMPFEANTFDGAYAIEATCHAPKVGSQWDDWGEVLVRGNGSSREGGGAVGA